MTDRATPLSYGERLWLDRFVAPLPRGTAILQLGCGGGEPFGRYLIDHGLQVVGIDRALPLIELARVRFPEHAWIHGDMRDTQIDGAFGGVLAWDSLQHLARIDQNEMAVRAAGWLLPGGRLLFNARTSDAVAMDGVRPGSRYYEDISAADYGGALAREGLVTVAHVAHEPACGNAGIWLARKP